MKTLWTLLTLAGMAGAQTRESLFDGKTLAGWHIQGPGTWTVTDGSIHALNPTRKWGHLVSNRTFDNGYVRFRFLNKVGNSGLYVRGAEGGQFGVKGLQVDIGFQQDGSAMLVTDSTWRWIQLLTKAVDSGYVWKDVWNELAVDVQGMGVKTYINGHLIWSSANVNGMAASGILALQLHEGADNDIRFKDLEMLTPTRIPYCPTPGDPAFRAGNDPDPALCHTVKIVAERPGKLRTGNRFVRDERAGILVLVSAPERDLIFNLQGARLPVFPSPTR